MDYRHVKAGEQRMKIISAIPNSWLWLPVLEVIYSYDYIRALGLRGLYEAVRDNADCVVLIDVLAYEESFNSIVSEIRKDNANRPIIFLVSENDLAFRSYLERIPDSCVITMHTADSTLRTALNEIILEHKETSFIVNLRKQKEVRSVSINDSSILNKHITRRSFLKGAAATAAAGVVVSGGGNLLSPLVEAVGEAGAGGDQIYYGSCRGNCQSGCRLKITVRDGKVVKTSMGEMPNPRYNRICQKGLTHAQLIYHPDRLKYPMRRVGERGSGEWERLSWEEAIDYIATKWKSYIADYGATSISFSQGSGNFGVSGQIYPPRLASVMGASIMTACVDGAYFYGSMNALGVSEWFNGNEPMDVSYAKCVFVVGANTSEAQIQSWSFINEAQKNGAKLIVIDPNYTITASKADIYVPIRPGTDTVLAMAMMNIVIQEGLTDIPFIKKSTVGPLLVKASDGKFLRASDLGALEEGKEDALFVYDAEGNLGTVDEIADPVLELKDFRINEGITVTTAYSLLVERVSKYTPEYAASFCDVDVDLIYEITRIFATNGPASIHQGYGHDHYTNGHYAYFAYIAFALLTGNAGKKGASPGCQLTLSPAFSSEITYPDGKESPLTIPGIEMLEVINSGKCLDTPVTPKSIFFHVHNPLANQGDRKSWLEVFDKLDLVIITDMMMTDSARYADIILPVAHWFEVVDLHGSTSLTPYLTLQEKAIDPLYECKDDFDIINMLGKAMGYEEYFSWTKEEMLEAIMDTGLGKSRGLTWEAINEKKVMPRFGTDHFIHGEGGVFPTSTGRAAFYLEDPQPCLIQLPQYGIKPIDKEKERLPYFEPPKEAWPDTVGDYVQNSLASKYPLIFSTERNKMKVHTIFGHNPWLLEIFPEPIVKISPRDADERNIKEDDLVKIFNDRGYVVVKAVINSGVRPGMLVMPKGWEGDQFIDGHYSDLTSRVTHEAINNNSFFDVLCQIELYKEV